MSEERKRILIVDDSPADIQFVMENLKSEYAILVATSGQKGIDLALGQPKPDVILMDVMMSGMNGYQACQALKNNPDTQDIDVIFISAHDTVEEKLAGYDAGGCDYLIKPVQPELLLQKVKLAIKNKQHKQEAIEERNEVFNTAMSAVSSAGEIGVILQFLRNSFVVESIEELAQMVIDFNLEFELNSTVQIRSDNQLKYFGTTNPIPPLEMELLSKLKESERIKEYNRRAIFNFGGVSMLIRNMPEDEELRGRMRDNFIIFLEGIDTKRSALEKDLKLATLVVDANQALEDISAKQKQHMEMSQQLMDRLLVDIESSFVSWGLTENQEDILIDLIQKSVNKSLDHRDQGTNIEDDMRDIINRLSVI